MAASSKTDTGEQAAQEPVPGAADATSASLPTHSASPSPAPARLPTATLAVTSLVTMVALMNYTTPMLSLPTLTAQFGTPLSAQAWLLNGTPLGLAALLLVAGSLADDYGRRRIFLIGTFALGVSTALGALAGDSLFFTLARVAQGAASAAVIASSLGLLVHAFPAGHARIRATGVWGAFVSGGIALGPLLAGALNSTSWRLPYVILGAAALGTGAYATRVLTESRAPHRTRPDLAGALTLALALVALLSALTLGRDGWLRAPVLLLLAAAVVLTAVFAVVERRTAAPLIDLGLLRRPLFQAATVGGLFTGLGVIGMMSYLPSLLQVTIKLSALGAAWLFVLWAGTAFVVALQARR